MTTWSSPQSLLLSHGQPPWRREARRRNPPRCSALSSPGPTRELPETSSPECFVKGQASEVKEAEILLCYQLAKFVTVIKEGVVSPFIREEDAVYKRNSRLLPPGQPKLPARHCGRDPRPRGTFSWLEMLLKDLQRAPACPQPRAVAASPRCLRARDVGPQRPLCCAAGQAEPPPKPGGRRGP